MDANVFPLNRLPSELFSLILDGEAHSYLLLPLWECGDVLLNQKLASGVRHVHLKSRWWLQPGLPSLLLKLRQLRHLAIDFYKNPMRNPPDWSKFITSLPKTLESLSVPSPSALFNYAPEWTLTNPICLQTECAGGSSRFIDLAQLFPHLHTLNVANVENVGTILPKDLAVLPPTLKHLTFPNLSSMAILPRSLETLTGYIGLFMAADIATFLATAPPSLTSIGPLGLHHPPNLSFLPRSLTEASFELSYDSYWEDRIDFLGFDTTSFPPRLQSLNIQVDIQDYELDDFTLNWPLRLPQYLTSLELKFDSPSAFGFAQIALLPRTLTSLASNSNFFDWAAIFKAFESATDAQRAALWPPNLNEFFGWATASVDHLAVLPPSIRTLGFKLIQDNSESMFVDTSKLPPKLTALIISSDKAISFNGALPSSLTSLKFSSPSTSFPSTLMVRESDCALPAGLRLLHVNLAFAGGPPHSGWKLPLVEDIRCVSFEADRLSLLPRSLLSLEIGEILVSGSPEVDLSVLPTSLTDLIIYEIDSDSNQRLLPSPHSFSKLRNLTSLRLINLSLTSDYLRYLPKSLRILETGLKNFEDDDAPFLPTRLVKLRLHIRASLRELPSLGEYWPIGSETLPSNPENASIVEKRRARLGL